MKMTTREFLKAVGAGGTGLLAGAATADSGMNTWDNGLIRDIGHTLDDVASAYEKEGKIYQPAREIPVFHRADVVIVGGGPAGFAAAVAAARTGAKTALVERYGSLGGLFTNGMVLIVLATSERKGGGYQFVTRGICREFIDRAVALGPNACRPCPDRPFNWQPTIDAEAAKVLMDRMVKDSGVDMFFHSWGVDVIQDGAAVKGIVFESKQGRQAILAKTVVDCTGDGDVAFQAGADYRQVAHALGFVFQIGNMDRIDAKVAKGTFPTHSNEPNRSLFWVNRLGPSDNGLDVRRLSAAEVMHREAAWRYVEEMRKSDGCGEVYLSNTCSQLGVRASRLVKSCHDINSDEAFARKSFDDVVGYGGNDSCTKPAFAIPYRALLPERTDNLLVAGRCMGCHPDMINLVRLIAPCMVSGQAAGTAAAMAVRSGTCPRDLDVSALRKRLQADGVYLG